MKDISTRCPEELRTERLTALRRAETYCRSLKREYRAALAEFLASPSCLTFELGRLLDGYYGDCWVDMAQEVLASRRMNRPQRLVMLIGLAAWRVSYKQSQLAFTKDLADSDRAVAQSTLESFIAIHGH